MPEYLSSEGGLPLSGPAPSEEDIRRRARGAAAIGYDPATGWGPGLSLSSMPGAPGRNDAVIFAAQRKRDMVLHPQQFGMEGPPAKTWEW